MDHRLAPMADRQYQQQSQHPSSTVPVHEPDEHTLVAGLATAGVAGFGDCVHEAVGRKGA